MTEPDITVIVCTRNRARWLDDCLASLSDQTAPASAYDVVVVDNGSTDVTKEVLRRHAAAAALDMRVEHEPRAGSSVARNLGVTVARGRIVAFLDDDARAQPGWVAALLDAYDWCPNASAVGGPIVLVWPDGRPAWIGASLEAWYSGLDLGPVRRAIEAPEELYGANLCLPREVLVAAGEFDSRLGRVGRALGSGEDWDLIRRARGHGPVVYDPAAGVEHVVLPERLSRRWLLRRTYAYGRNSRALEPASAHESRRGDLVAAARHLAAAATHPRRLARELRLPSSPTSMEGLAQRAIKVGEAVAAAESATKRLPRN